MGIWIKVIRSVTISVSVTLAVLAVMSREPGLEIPMPYWVLGALLPLCLSGTISYLLARQAERIGRLNDELAEAYARMKALAETDPLTGLANRATFVRAAEELHARQPGRILMIDLDHFKAINDTHGHAVGDHVLNGIAQTLLRCARSGDLVGRIGGEEFAMFLPDTDAETAMLQAEPSGPASSRSPSWMRPARCASPPASGFPARPAPTCLMRFRRPTWRCMAPSALAATRRAWQPEQLRYRRTCGFRPWRRGG